MYELNNIEGKGKDATADYSSTKYTSLDSSPSISTTKSKRPVKLNPPLWNTLEFYIHFFIVIISIVYMFYVGYHISKETNPNYAIYSKRLEDGWLFGRKDNSDAQFASFRDNYGALLLALISYLFLSHLYRIYFVPKSPAKLSTQPLRRTYFFLSFALIFLYILFGNSLFKILIILSINFLITMTLQGSKLNPIITWIFNLAVLFANERYDAYKFEWINESLAFLDSNVGLLARWDVTFNICMLRMVSFNMDYYWSYHPSPDSTEKNDRDHAPLTEKDRIIGSCFKEDYNYINYLSYILYTPLFLAGPIITFNNFISQASKKKLRYPKEIDIKSTFIYGVRLLAAILTMEIMLHFIYVVAISKSRAWMGFTPFELKVGTEVIIDGLLGVKYSTYNMLIVFTFVALWHDISLKLLAWGWLIWIFILPETIVTRIFTEKRFGDYPYYRHLCAVGGVLNLLTMWAANLVGFAVGLDGMKVLLSDIFRTSDGLISLGICCISIFCAVQIMFEIREEEKRKNINQEIRY
ncbi:4285_t:CDS:10 [Funneliformis caledonium]|uniref:4285_t:CDS:1 n=1 Tax=Funneliformis caledonium TaxID=1117310 RepID=A0A9N8V7Y8_9GLOM|nr:4285_t:CDS:10 [Funneliformis caledonium]